MTRLAYERLAATIILAVGGFWLVESFRFGELSAIFPRVVAAALMVLAVLWLAQTIVGARPATNLATTPPAGQTPPDRALQRRAARQSLSLILALLCWTALVPWIGLLYASILGVTGLTLASFWGSVGTRRSVIVALIVVMVFYAAFRFLIRVPFPLPVWM